MSAASDIQTHLEEVQLLVKPSILNRWSAHDNVITCRKRNRDLHYIVCASNQYAAYLLIKILEWEKSHAN